MPDAAEDAPRNAHPFEKLPEFDQAMRKLLKVPKEEVDRRKERTRRKST